MKNQESKSQQLPPTVEIFQGHTPELRRADATIVIDVIRAFTTTHVAFERGAAEVLLAGEVAEAFALARAHPQFVLAGERHALKIEGFDLGNSPHECAQYPFDGRGMILTTTNGVRATLHARSAGPVLVTGYTNAATTAEHLRRRAAAGEVHRVNIVASHPTGDEDVACAEFIGARIRGDDASVSDEAVRRRILASEAAQKFLDPDRPEYDERDVEICATPRPSNFVMYVEEGDAQPVIRTKIID